MSKQKESYYFPHDYNAVNDPKVMGLLNQFGAVGYGVYWRLIEMLHEDRNHKLPFEQYIYISVSITMKLTPKEIEEIIYACINPYRLFDADGVLFWSERVLRNIAIREEIIKAKSKAGKESARKRKEEKRLARLAEKQHMLTRVEQPLTYVNK